MKGTLNLPDFWQQTHFFGNKNRGFKEGRSLFFRLQSALKQPGKIKSENDSTFLITVLLIRG